MVRRRVLRLFRRRELLDEPTALNMLTWQAAGGFSIDASVRISGRDRAGRERLLRYCARPPFALERLRIERVHSARSAGGAGAGIAGTSDLIRHVLYQPSRAMPDGRTLLVLSPLATAAEPEIPGQGRPGNDTPVTPAQTAARSRWARLIARIYEDYPLSCPDCGAEMRILAFLTDSFTVVGILRHLGLPHTEPPLTPTRYPPRDLPACDADPFLDLDQTPAFDPTEPDPIPDFDFDQTWGASGRSRVRRESRAPA